jgi:hypothetical protein
VDMVHAFGHVSFRLREHPRHPFGLDAMVGRTRHQTTIY